MYNCEIGYLLMPVYTKNNKNILFVHIPKTGGSSVEKIFIEKGWDESFISNGKRSDIIKIYKSSLQHLHSPILRDIFNLSNFNKIFSIVRNPFDRCKSEYYWQLRLKIISSKINPPEKWLNDILIDYKKNNYIFDNHIRPQNEFIVEGVKVFKLEDGLTKAYEYAFDESPFIMPRINKNKNPLKFFGKQRSDLTLKKSKKNKFIEDQFLKLKPRIIDFYSKDYEFFKY